MDTINIQPLEVVYDFVSDSRTLLLRKTSSEVLGIPRHQHSTPEYVVVQHL